MRLIPDLPYCCTLLPHYAYHRFITGKYGPDTPEKLGRLPAHLTPEGPCLWTHAVSVGETEAARTLIEAFADAHPDWSRRISTTTATGREVAKKRFGDERVFYYPLDLSCAVGKAFDHIRPSLIVLMELEVWPNFLAEAESRQVPVVVSNVRITERSVRRFKRFAALARPMLDRVTLWLSQSEAYAESLREIGVRPDRIAVVGSVKYDTVNTTIDPAVRTRYRELAGVADGESLFVAGSTHPGEEEIVLAAWTQARAALGSRVVLTLAPRHPERASEVEALCRKAGAVTRRSALNEADVNRSDILLVDVVGELGRHYAAADAVFVGGSFREEVGGHNILEPCALGRPTVTGPEMHNFAEPMDRLRAARGICQIERGEQLGECLQEFLQHPAKAAEQAARARGAIVTAQGATAATLQHLERVIQHA